MLYMSEFGADSLDRFTGVHESSGGLSDSTREIDESSRSFDETNFPIRFSEYGGKNSTKRVSFDNHLQSDCLAGIEGSEQEQLTSASITKMNSPGPRAPIVAASFMPKLIDPARD